MRTLSLLILTAFSCVAQSLSPIVQVEYFVDTDPGIGNATQVSIVPGTDVEAAFSFDPTSLSVGWHTLYVRARNDSGWSIMFRRNFLKSQLPPPPANIVEVEYFYGSDPGVGRAKKASVTAGNDITVNIPAGANGFLDSRQKLWIRAKDSNGIWSMPSVSVVGVRSIVPPPAIVSVRYFFSKGTQQSALFSYNGFTPGQDVDLTFSTDPAALSSFTLQSGDAVRLHVIGIDAAGNSSLMYVSPAINVQ